MTYSPPCIIVKTSSLTPEPPVTKPPDWYFFIGPPIAFPFAKKSKPAPKIESTPMLIPLSIILSDIAPNKFPKAVLKSSAPVANPFIASFKPDLNVSPISLKEPSISLRKSLCPYFKEASMPILAEAAASFFKSPVPCVFLLSSIISLLRATDSSEVILPDSKSPILFLFLSNR